MDTNFIKSTNGILMLFDVVASAVGIGLLNCKTGYPGSLEKGWGAYILSALVITLILALIFYILLVLQKLPDDKMMFGFFFLCGVLMIIAIVGFAIDSNFFNCMNAAGVLMIMITASLIIQLLMKLGLLKA